MAMLFSLLSGSPTQLEVTSLINEEVSEEVLLAMMPANIDGKIRSQIIRSDEVLVVALADVLNTALSSPDRKQTSEVLAIMQHFIRLHSETVPSTQKEQLLSEPPRAN